MKNQIQQNEMNVEHSDMFSLLAKQDGKIGYIIAWLLGVPASLLFVIFLIRGG